MNQSPDIIDGFDAVDRKWYVLAAKTCADIPASVSGTPYDAWIIAGDTRAAPDGTNDEDGGTSDFANAEALEPGHIWPFKGLASAEMQSTLASTI